MDWLEHLKQEREMWITINDSINVQACGRSKPHTHAIIDTRIDALSELIRIGTTYDNDNEALFKIYRKTANETYDIAIEMSSYIPTVLKMPRRKNETN